MKRIGIVGAGIAGCAAAWKARRAGHDVVLANATVGATSLASGAIDDTPWYELERAARTLENRAVARALDAEVEAFFTAFGRFSIPAAGSRRPLYATGSGSVRSARGGARELLDLGTLDEGVVLVPRALRPDWDADLLVRSLSHAKSTPGLRFEAIDATLLRFEDEWSLSDVELARRHDEDARIDWFCERLRRAVQRTSASAILVGPWLGVDRDEAYARFESNLGVRVGEILSSRSGSAGARFENARATFLGSIGVSLSPKVTAVDTSEGLALTFATGETKPIDRLVLAVGGLVSGGIVFAPRSGDDDHAVRGSLRLNLAFDEDLAWVGADASSLWGSSFDHDAMHSLERIGLPARVRAHVVAAGDLVADRPRTAISAAQSGLDAATLVL